jgi:hypothetical protein
MKVLIGDALRNAAMRFGVALDLWARGSEDEKQHDAETIQEPAFVWTAGAVKARLLELLDGHKADAKEAWINGGGDSLTEFSAEAADRLAAEWHANQPAPEEPTLPLDEEAS